MTQIIGKLGIRLPWLADFFLSLSMIRRAALTLYPGDTLFHRWRRTRLWLRSLVCWHPTIVWLRRCSNSPLREIVMRHPRALERPHRPFLHKAFGSYDRIAVSLYHQAWSLRYAPNITQRIAREGSTVIARFAVGAEQWQVTLESLDQFQMEGDWTLCIRDMAGRRVVSCTFSVACLGGKIERARLCVGSVQGPDSPSNGRELFRALTKRWHGLRPKVLAVYLAQCVAAGMGAHGTVIIAKRSHIYESWRYCLRRRRVSADYDALSRECGAAARWNGWFLLPRPPAYGWSDSGNAIRRRRNALRASLAAQIGGSFAH
ncbi:DUF535 family protein [Paraburkholderia ferrariae]|uniref:DUF535 family protein n=1 Tax=Paraburkholderia ferrariae TaxID=386056 RepID=UPI000480C94E|nr:DUF535 family protein [Paraburkholderia ferrariae]